MFGAIHQLEASGRAYKTLTLSDTQGVLADESLIDQAIAAHPDADIVCLPGDVGEWAAASKYAPERDIPLMHESEWLVRFYQRLTDAYPNKPIIITNSNHRRRVERSMKLLPPSLLFLAEHNIERYLAQPFPWIVAIEPWWVQLGDTIYAHKEGRTAIPGNNVRDAIQTFRNWRDSGQFDVKDFRLVLTGHSHKVAELMEHGVKGIEPGCLAKLPMSYMTSAAVKGTQSNGYAVVVQTRGRADFNASRVIHLDPTLASARVKRSIRRPSATAAESTPLAQAA